MTVERVAIVGRGGVFPGAHTLADFWKNIAEGLDCGRPVPPTRWSLRPEWAISDAPGTPPDRVPHGWGCYLESLPELPADLESATRELEGLDPLFRIGLAAAVQAWRDARTTALDRQRVGVILGHIVLPTEATSALSRTLLLPHFAAGVLGHAGSPNPPCEWSQRNWSAAGLPAVCIARVLGLGGLAFTLDAACASSLYALHLACEELLAGRADAMLAGGLSRPDCQYTQMGFAQLQALSRRGRCAPLSATADGLVVGEGAGVFVLKRLSDALRDGDRIYATIAGIGLSNDRGANLLAPRSEGQLRAMRAAYLQAGWSPEDVDLIECHATGTPLGDGVELDSLHDLWKAARPLKQPCILGSVKSNVGHLLTAAGSASLMKILAALETATLPPTANFERPAAGLERPGSPFRVLQQAEPWTRREPHRPRRAAINAFGFGGINAHVLIEEWTGDLAPRRDHSVQVPIDLTRLPARRGEGETPHHAERETPIAIVGMAAHWGPWKDLAAIRELCWGGVHAIELQPPRGWGLESTQTASHHFREGLPRGYVVEQLDVPLGAFRIPPVEMAEMSAQQVLMLQTAAAALDDAGLGRELGDQTGVFVGIGLDPHSTNFHVRWTLEEQLDAWAGETGRNLTPAERTAWLAELRAIFGPPLTANRVMGHLGGIVASRLAREFDVGGPCFTVSSDELSGWHALHAAVRALQSGRLQRALVGAVDFPSDIRRWVGGRPDDASVKSRFCDGAIALVLKRLDDAQRKGDRIYAVIANLCCISPPVASPSNPVQELLEELGDCGAMTALVPVVHGALALHHRLKPTFRHGLECWLHDRVAGPRTYDVLVPTPQDKALQISLVEADPVATPRLGLAERFLNPNPLCVFPIEGDSLAELEHAAAELATRVNDSVPLEQQARAWLLERPLQPERRMAAALLADTPETLKQRLVLLQRKLRGETIREAGVYFTTEPMLRSGKLAFVFPGSGNHFPGMGRELLAAWPEVVNQQSRENQRLYSQFRPGLSWHSASAEVLAHQPRAMIFSQVSLGAAVCDWLALFGICPQAAIGYSLGESTALFALRAWTDRDEMLRRMEASPLFGSELVAPFEAARKAWHIPPETEVPWMSGVVNRSADEVRNALQQVPRVYLLIINTPSQCVIGGERDGVLQVVKKLEAHFVPLIAPSTVHCEIVRVVAPDYRQLHVLATTPPPDVDFYSGAWGRRYALSAESAADAILAQAIQTVDFPRLIESAYADGVRGFLEIGPGSSCTKMIAEILSNRPHWGAAVCPVTADPLGHALSILAELIVQRLPVDLSALYGAPEETAVRRAQAADRGRMVMPVHLPPFSPRDLRKSSTKPLAPQPLPASLTHAASKYRPSSVTRACSDPLPAPVVAPQPAVCTGSPPRIVAATQALVAHASPIESPTASMRTTSAVSAAPSVNSSARGAVTEPASWLGTWSAWMSERAAAHAAFLEFADHAQQLAEKILHAATSRRVPNPQVVPISTHPNGHATTHRREDISLSRPAWPDQLTPPEEPPRSLNYAQCLEFAVGKIGNVLGPRFAPIDAFPTRVRLPDVPLMLVDRILAIEGEPLSLTHGRVITEHDIHPDDWYLDGGRIPTCLAVESGQADLFLSGWLGIDFQTQGRAMYRLLDAVVTFHDALPGPGQTIRYDIRINRFFRQGETYLFRFEFDATVDGRPLLTMREGCAGFFTPAELAAGQGIVQTALDRQPRPGILPADWSEFVPLSHESYTEEQLDALRRGDLAACFGPRFADLPLRRPATLPSGRMRLVHRITRLEPQGGKYGLGLIRGEADIHPEDWFLVCHFCDDQVMPGTLMYECCLHTLRIYLLRMGWIGEQDQVVYEPVPGVKSRLKCRGQVTASTRTVWYDITIKELGYGSPQQLGDGSSWETPYCLADALMYADGKPIVEITDMSVQLSGLTRQDLEQLWAETSAPRRVEEIRSTISVPRRLSRRPPLFDRDRITAFAIGKPSEAFGERYRVFDSERVIARLPGPPFQFLDRITSIEHCEPWVLKPGGVILAEYDVPSDAWYFAANRQQRMPFAVLLEVALQPCGWLAAYLGSALTSDIDLSFRNLGGCATQWAEVTPRTGTLTTQVTITQVSQSAGMIIQHFEFDVRCEDQPVYQGTTYFGFFSKAALRQQVGLRDATCYQPTESEQRRGLRWQMPDRPPFPSEQLRMVQEIELLVPDGGPQGLGFVRGSIPVDPEAWFFKAHFYQDPVWPGSLGLESFLQLLKVYATQRWGDGLMVPSSHHRDATITPAETNLSVSRPLEFSAVALGRPHTWTYRGQVLPSDRRVTVEAVITAVDDQQRWATASGYLSVDGRVIYHMNDFSIQVLS